MSKKFLVILIVAVIIVLIAGIFAYKYFGELKSIVQNYYGGPKTETPSVETPAEQKKDSGPENSNENIETPQVQIQAEGISVEGNNGGGGLTVCSDRCGDGTCQKSDPDCKAGSMNCICPETAQDCHQDCK